MLEMLISLHENPNQNSYNFKVSGNDIPKDLKMLTFKSMIENIIGGCNINLRKKANSDLLEFKITKYSEVN